MKIFREINIGGISKEELLRRLGSAGVQFNEYAKILFKNPSFDPDSVTTKAILVKAKPLDLGIENPYSIEKIIEAASNLGLSPCPLYLAAFLRLEYLDQPEGPYLTIASTRLEDDENYPTGLYLRNVEGLLWLRGFRAIGECDHPTDNEFIFLA